MVDLHQRRAPSDFLIKKKKKEALEFLGEKIMENLSINNTKKNSEQRAFKKRLDSLHIDHGIEITLVYNYVPQARIIMKQRALKLRPYRRISDSALCNFKVHTKKKTL